MIFSWAVRRMAKLGIKNVVEAVAITFKTHNTYESELYRDSVGLQKTGGYHYIVKDSEQST